MKKSVAMIIEGSYPYIIGGVASWCHQLLTKLDDFDFKVIAILPEDYKKKEKQYQFPSTVVDYQEIWLQAPYQKSRSKGTERRAFSRGLQNGSPESLTHEIGSSRNGRWSSFWDMVRDFRPLASHGNFQGVEPILRYLITHRDLDPFDLFSSRELLALIKDLYHESFQDVAFLKFFWTMQTILRPVYCLTTYPLLPADTYHTVSTGYAGLVGILAKLEHGSPLVLTEHGIYMNERSDELEKSTSIEDRFRSLWKNFFHMLCSVTYDFSDRVITLYKENALKEIEELCDPDRIEIIPNGVSIDTFSRLFPTPSDQVRVGIVARVVPIKDIKTFLRAARVCLDRAETGLDLGFFILGPTDEDEKYYAECLQLTEELGLKDKVVYTGPVNMTEYYPLIDIMVLTSEREAQPLTLIEAMAAHIPCVASDVGSCRDILEGVGYITTRADPEKTAEAILHLARHPQLRKTLGEKGCEKAALLFRRDDVIGEYRRIYNRY